jgi:thiamine pyrophosphate-dependent acetolactate synthase large subunit-like protein
MTLMALGMLPKAHPLSLGMLGMHGARSTNFILQEADLLIVLGARFDDRAIGKTEQFCPNAKIITWISTAPSWVKSSSRTWRFRAMWPKCWRS